MSRIKIIYKTDFDSVKDEKEYNALRQDNKLTFIDEKSNKYIFDNYTFIKENNESILTIYDDYIEAYYKEYNRSFTISITLLNKKYTQSSYILEYKVNDSGIVNKIEIDFIK